MNINGYILKADLKNDNSGFSKWGFATKNGKEYFIKELLNPVYPIDRDVIPDELFERRRSHCLQYEQRLKKIFDKINNASHGNLIRINDFFRFGSRYYLVTEKVKEKSIPANYFSALEENKKLLFLKTVAYCFYDLHSAGVIHFDVKPSNILIKDTKSGSYTAKLIDFDSSFLNGEDLKNRELGGDLTYFAPETFLSISGEDVYPDEKADIFGLGLVFHEYYCGKLPNFDTKEYEYPYEAKLDGGSVLVDSEIPKEIAELINSMLDVEPKKRPTAEEIIIKLNEIIGNDIFNVSTDIVNVEEDTINTKNNDWFHPAGDL